MTLRNGNLGVGCGDSLAFQLSASPAPKISADIKNFSPHPGSVPSEHGSGGKCLGVGYGTRFRVSRYADNTLLEVFIPSALKRKGKDAV